MNLPSTSIPRAVSREGFTLIEILIAIAIITILAGMGLWISMDVYRNYSYRSEKETFISAIQKARLESMVNLNESAHGIRVESDKYIIFRGSSYSASSSFNRTIVPSGPVTITGNPSLPQDIVFDQLSGTTSSSGTLTVSDSVRTAVISINNEGQISW